MSAVYPSALEAFLRAEIDVLTEALKFRLLEGYVFDAAHTTLADVPAPTRVAAALTPDNVSVAAGALLIPTINWPTVEADHIIDALVLYAWRTTDADSPLICHIDRTADHLPLAVTTGGQITLRMDPVFRL